MKGRAVLTADPASVSSCSYALDCLADGTTPIEIELAEVRWVSEKRCGLECIRISSEMPNRLASFVSVRKHTASYLTATARTCRYAVSPLSTF